jgi:hypothetical protein
LVAVFYFYINAQCNAANRSRETYSSHCDQTTNKLNASNQSTWPPHRRCLYMFLCSCSQSIPGLLYYRFTSNAVSVPSNHYVFCVILGILSLSQTASGHTAKREMPKVVRVSGYTIPFSLRAAGTSLGISRLLSCFISTM